MPSTRQDLAVAAANTLLGLMLQFRELRQKTAEFLNQYNSEAYGAVWAALLTAQGKWLADFFVFAHADALLLDCEAAQIPMLIQRCCGPDHWCSTLPTGPWTCMTSASGGGMRPVLNGATPRARAAAWRA